MKRSRKSGLQPSSTDLRAVRRADETLEEYARRKEVIAEAKRKARSGRHEIHIYDNTKRIVVDQK